MSGKAHLFVLVITLCNIGFILRMVRHHQMRAKYSVLWLSVGGALIVLAASPSTLDRFSRMLGVSYEPATYFMVAIAFLFVLAIHFSWELSRLEDRIRSLAEELAIRDARPFEQVAASRSPGHEKLSHGDPNARAGAASDHRQPRATPPTAG